MVQEVNKNTRVVAMKRVQLLNDFQAPVCEEPEKENKVRRAYRIMGRTVFQYTDNGSISLFLSTKNETVKDFPMKKKAVKISRHPTLNFSEEMQEDKIKIHCLECRMPIKIDKYSIVKNIECPNCHNDINILEYCQEKYQNSQEVNQVEVVEKLGEAFFEYANDKQFNEALDLLAENEFKFIFGMLKTLRAKPGYQ